MKSDLFLGLFHLSVAQLSSSRSLFGRVKHSAFLRSISGTHPFMFGLQIQLDHCFCTIICLVVGVFVFCVRFKRENVTESGRPSDRHTQGEERDRDRHTQRGVREKQTEGDSDRDKDIGRGETDRDRYTEREMREEKDRQR